MKTLVIPDLHGRFDLLEKALHLIESTFKEGTVIFLGDYVDRGPDSYKVINRLIEGSHTALIFKFLCGNHEDMMLDACVNNIADGWILNGGLETLKSYNNAKDCYDVKVVPQKHIDWLLTLPDVLYDEHRVYVHAGVSESYSLSNQPETMTKWFRYPDGADVGWNGKHVVHGHTPKLYGPELYTNRTNLDVGATFTGKLVIGVFDDNIAGGPVDLLWIKK